MISDFEGVNEAGFWLFTGEVSDDESVAGLEVRFGGLLHGEVATVGSDGTFSITILLPPGVQGTVTAITTDDDGLDSNEAREWIQD